jgi:archaemetzincin
MLRTALVIGSATVFGGLFWVSHLAGSAAPQGPAPSAAPDVAAAPIPVSRRSGPPKSAPFVEQEDATAFPPLPPAGPGDWRTAHPENAQSFEEFRRGRRRHITAQRRVLHLLPLGDVARAGVEPAVLREHLAAYFGVPVQVQENADPPGFTTRVNAITGGEQTLTGDVLDWLEGRIPKDAYGVVAVTAGDLYPAPSWNFVFGQASLSSGVGVFSLARMDPGFPNVTEPSSWRATQRTVVLRRCLKIVTHEVGHMFGVEHCLHGLCLMNGCNHMAEMDRAPLHACPQCLRKFAHATGLDVLQRYRQLEAIYRRVGLVPEAEWVTSRLTRLAAR